MGCCVLLFVGELELTKTKRMPKVHTMTRTNIHLTEGQREQLRYISESSGLSAAELVRRAVDDFVENWRCKQKKSSSRRIAGSST